MLTMLFGDCYLFINSITKGEVWNKEFHISPLFQRRLFFSGASPETSHHIHKKEDVEMDHNLLARKAFDSSFRIEKLFYLAGIGGDPSDDVIGFFSEEKIELIEGLIGENHDDMKEDFDQDASSWELGDMINSWLEYVNKLGFLVKLASPVYDEKGGHSWGHYRTKWFYSENLEDLYDIGEKWADSFIPEHKEK